MDGCDEWREFEYEGIGFGFTQKPKPMTQKEIDIQRLTDIKNTSKKVVDLTESIYHKLDDPALAYQAQANAFKAFSLARMVYDWLDDELKRVKRRV